MAHSKYINVPVELLKQTRGDRRGRSLAAFAVALKSWSPSSRYDFKTMRQFCEDFGICYRKAKSLLESAKNSPLFRFTENGGIIANKFLPLYGKSKFHCGQHHYRFMHEIVAAKVYCRDRGNIRINDIERELNESMVMYLVSVQIRMNEFTGRDSLHPFEEKLTQGKIAAFVGVSQRSVIRYVKSLEQKHELVVLRHEPEEYGGIDPTYLNRWFYPYIHEPNEYRLTNKLRFANIIDYHKRRINGVPSRNILETKKASNGESNFKLTFCHL